MTTNYIINVGMVGSSLSNNSHSLLKGKGLSMVFIYADSLSQSKHIMCHHNSCYTPAKMQEVIENALTSVLCRYMIGYGRSLLQLDPFRGVGQIVVTSHSNLVQRTSLL